MTLTLTKALGIELKLVPIEEDRALQLARHLWDYDGRPIERRALCQFLERILSLCQSEGIRYPAILLRRKKELERGTWAPDPALAIPEEPAGDTQCTICRGAGMIVNPGGLSGRACECYIRKLGQKRTPAAPKPGASSDMAKSANTSTAPPDIMARASAEQGLPLNQEERKRGRR